MGKLVHACLECQPSALVIADDIAYQRSTVVKATELEQNLFVYYRDWIKEAHRHGIAVYFHSDGNLTGILPGLIACGFDGIAGCELECQDVPALKAAYGTKLILLTGITSGLLEHQKLTSRHRHEFLKLSSTLNEGGNFILGSGSGLSSAKQLANLKTLYQWADEALEPK